MLDISFIADNVERVKQSAKARGVDVDIDKLLQLDEQRRQQIAEVEQTRNERNKIADMGGQPPTQEQIDKGRALKEKLTLQEAELDKIAAEYQKIIVNVPNILHESVPIGGEDSFEVVETIGTKPEFDFEVKDHQQLGESLDLIDLKTAADISGSRFYFLKNDAVRLEYAVISWLSEKLSSKGFTLTSVPTMVRQKQMEDTGFFPAEENEIYSVNPGEDDLFLIGTSEVPLTALGKNVELTQQNPVQFFSGFSTCYRREAGSYGKDTAGIFRVHQFDKLEMYAFCLPEKSWEVHEQLLEIEKEILDELGLNYQVVNIPSGDLGAPAAKKYDCNVWIPSQERYRELTSCSNVTDFQARRAKLKFRGEDGKTHYMHTLNGTAMAWTRTLLAIMENYQTIEGRIEIPEVLRPYMGGKSLI